MFINNRNVLSFLNKSARWIKTNQDVHLHRDVVFQEVTNPNSQNSSDRQTLFDVYNLIRVYQVAIKYLVM